MILGDAFRMRLPNLWVRHVKKHFLAKSKFSVLSRENAIFKSQFAGGLFIFAVLALLPRVGRRQKHKLGQHKKKMIFSRLLVVFMISSQNANNQYISWTIVFPQVWVSSSTSMPKNNVFQIGFEIVENAKIGGNMCPPCVAKNYKSRAHADEAPVT